VTDLAGFVAATLTRGVPFINVPTTILAAADASIGGKTGVDTPAATNLVGVFHQPRAVYIDLATWRTLPAEQIRNGLAETIKHACLADNDFFALLEAVFVGQGRAPEELVRDIELMRQVAQRNAKIKSRFVGDDVHESNLRMALNLGHTFGRALEAAEDYTVSHGRAMAIGLMLQAHWGVELGFVTHAVVDRRKCLLESVALPTALPPSTTNEQLVAKMLHDKKALARVVRFVFQRGIEDIQTFEQGSVVRPAGVEEILRFLVHVRR
jgi:3-dehydroquinate synthase